MYQLVNLSKIYNKQPVLSDLNLRFQKGRFVALLGRNGSGKSTLMRLLAQHEPFETGDILFQNQTLRSPRLQLAQQIAFITEEMALPVAIDLKTWGREFARIHAAYDIDLFQSLAKQFEIDLGKSLLDLSRGQKAKALFSLHAAKKPSIYILDEITSVLDSGSRVTLMRFLEKERTRGCLIIMSTNIAGELQGYATDVCFLEKGHIEFAATAEEIPQHFLKIKASESEVQSLRLVEKGFRFIDKNADGSWTLIVRKKDLTTDYQAHVDRRALTISELTTYFTSTVTA
ncbi:MAG: ATP-binding cassette domain-containing protein [Bdellovibrionales bacterium]|nr:ATP-binding cassette domain-containing protein [Bdellovibrionales bacterium]